MERLTKRLHDGKALCIGVCEKECTEGHSECHKCKPFAEVKSGRKNFELRKDEDDIQAGDILVLCEWDGENYTGAEVSRTVKYVLRDVQEYGLKEGYCVIGW